VLLGSLIFFALSSLSTEGYRWFQQFCIKALDIVDSRVPLIPWIVLLVPLAVAATAIVSIARQLLATHRLVHALFEDEVVLIDQRLRRAAVRVGIDDHIRLVVSAEFFAFCFGLFRPTVCISTTAARELPAKELEAVLRHESWHARRRDPLKLLLANALGSALFFLPVVRDFAQHYALTKELRADNAAVEAMDDTHPLAAALYRAATRTTALPLRAAVGAFNSTDTRVDQLLGEGPPSFRAQPRDMILTSVALLSLSLLLCMSVMAARLGGVGVCPPCR